MLLTSSSIVPEVRDPADALAIGDDALAGKLAAEVRSAFPDLRFSTAVVEERGGDHRVLLLDAAYAFRFPRATMHGLHLEIAVLAVLRGRCDIAVPEYRFVDPAGRFAGYPFIKGDELKPRRFAALSVSARRHVLDQAGRFLAALHSLAPDDVLPAPRWPLMASAARQVADARKCRLPQIAQAFPQVGRAIDAFYDACPFEPVVGHVILHGDLVDDHILLARDGCSLAGVIDFSDVALGDPAQDFRSFWVYGSAAVTRVIAAYELDAGNDLYRRSYWAFIRYQIDRFADLLTTEGRGAAAASVPNLARLLSASDPPNFNNKTPVPDDTYHTKRRRL